MILKNVICLTSNICFKSYFEKSYDHFTAVNDRCTSWILKYTLVDICCGYQGLSISYLKEFEICLIQPVRCYATSCFLCSFRQKLLLFSPKINFFGCVCKILDLMSCWRSYLKTRQLKGYVRLFRVLPNFHECFYNSIGTRRTCFLFLLENTVTRKRKSTCLLRSSKCKFSLFAQSLRQQLVLVLCFYWVIETQF